MIKKISQYHANINYVRVRHKETLYQSWNRGIKLAKGKYITNANTDDRHSKNCLEVLVRILEEDTRIDIAYGNLYKSTIPNETFKENDKSTPCYSQKFHPGSLLLHDFIGAQPVWRKSLHDKIGLFDESFEVVGDYEFFLRAASNGCKFIHEPRAEGIMLWHQGALSTRDSKGIDEKNLLFEKYRNPKEITQFYEKNISSKVFNPNIDSFLDLGIRSLCYFPLFATNTPQFDFKFASLCFEQLPNDSTFKHNLLTLNQVSKLSEANNQDTHFFYGSQNKFSTEYELKKVSATYLKKKGMEKFHGKYREKFIFNSKEFLKSLFWHLPIHSLKKYEQIFIFGCNERGKLLGGYLSDLGYNNITFVDNYFGKIKDSSKSLDFKISSFDDLNSSINSCFILAMSSHHWISVSEQILSKFPDSEILKIDKT